MSDKIDLYESAMKISKYCSDSNCRECVFYKPDFEDPEDGECRLDAPHPNGWDITRKKDKMDLFYCSKCKKWFDLNDKFEPLILGTKSPDGYNEICLCQKCGRLIDQKIKEMIYGENSNE